MPGVPDAAAETLAIAAFGLARLPATATGNQRRRRRCGHPRRRWRQRRHVSGRGRGVGAHGGAALPAGGVNLHLSFFKWPVALLALVPSDCHETHHVIIFTIVTHCEVTRPRLSVERRTRTFLLALSILAVAAAFATAAAITLGGFFVESTVNSGVAAATAGFAFAFGSVISILVRLLVGAYADRYTGNLLGVVAIMIFVGSCTSLIFVFQTPTAHFIGLPLAFGAGWAWPGLFNLSVVRASPGFPGRATGITQTGVYVGGAVGPVLFGLTAEHWSYSAAWVLAAVLGLCAAAAVLIGRKFLYRP